MVQHMMVWLPLVGSPGTPDGLQSVGGFVFLSTITWSCSVVSNPIGGVHRHRSSLMGFCGSLVLCLVRSVRHQSIVSQVSCGVGVLE